MYPAPLHIHIDQAAIDKTLDAYRCALESFDRPVLEQPWQKNAQENRFWPWPKLVDILKACQLLQPKSEQREDWVAKAAALMDAHVGRFVRTAQAAIQAERVWLRTRAQGLRNRSRLVSGPNQCGAPTAQLRGFPLFGERSTPEERQEFVAKDHEQAAKGPNRGSVPHAKIQVGQEYPKG